MKPRSEADYNRNLAALARRAFEAHELVTCDHADPREATRWRVAKPADRGGWETFYWTEVVELLRLRPRSLAELAELLDVTPRSIRRDLLSVRAAGHVVERRGDQFAWVRWEPREALR